MERDEFLKARVHNKLQVQATRLNELISYDKSCAQVESLSVC